MADPFVAEIRPVAFNFAPPGWALCNGQLLPISQNTALFSLLGTYYGGDGRSTFALPNLQGVMPLGQGQGSGLSDRLLGEEGGVAAVSLLQTEIPQHTHILKALNTPGNTSSPAGALWAQPRYGRTTENSFAPSPLAPGAAAQMSPSALALTGSNEPHNNLPPYLAINFIIAMQGVFPPRG
ncbi:phage tail protein [Leifsonia sp. YAF41]|uniref:phage tail protein n=1 Tax=Leifsonia sp. YAF41 TaxID=3233086 RepID=UPI003F952B47